MWSGLERRRHESAGAAGLCSADGAAAGRAAQRLVSGQAAGRRFRAPGGERLAGQWEKARTGAEEARSHWEQRRRVWAVFADHTPMEEIDAQFARLIIHAAAREKGEFAAGCAALARQLEAMGNAHRLSWQNIL